MSILSSQNKHQIKPIELPEQKPTKIYECYVELFDNCLHYVVDFLAEEPIDTEDRKLGVEEKHSSFNIWVEKDKISGIEKSLTETRKWTVSIIVTGFSEDLLVYFNSESAATTLQEKLVKWRFDRE